MTSAHYRLDTLTAVVDRNELQAMGSTEERMGVEPLVQKWQAFGWKTWEIDGHDMGEICGALEEATETKERPGAIIAHTVKGKGVPFMEGQPGFHNATITEEQFREAAATLEAKVT